VDTNIIIPSGGPQQLNQTDVKKAIDNNVQNNDENGENKIASSSQVINIGDRDMFVDHFFQVDPSNIHRANALAQVGAMKYFKMSGCEVATFVIIAFIMSVANSLLVWFSPCLGKSTCQG